MFLGHPASRRFATPPPVTLFCYSADSSSSGQGRSSILVEAPTHEPALDQVGCGRTLYACQAPVPSIFLMSYDDVLVIPPLTFFISLALMLFFLVLSALVLVLFLAALVVFGMIDRSP